MSWLLDLTAGQLYQEDHVNTSPGRKKKVTHQISENFAHQTIAPAEQPHELTKLNKQAHINCHVAGHINENISIL